MCPPTSLHSLAPSTPSPLSEVSRPCIPMPPTSSYRSRSHQIPQFNPHHRSRLVKHARTKNGKENCPEMCHPAATRMKPLSQPQCEGQRKRPEWAESGHSGQTAEKCQDEGYSRAAEESGKGKGTEKGYSRAVEESQHSAVRWALRLHPSSCTICTWVSQLVRKVLIRSSLLADGDAHTGFFYFSRGTTPSF